MKRRTFTKQILNTVITYGLLDVVISRNAFGRPVQPIVDHWAIELNEYCNDLKKQFISPEEWQNQIELLLKKIELSELLSFIEFKKLTKDFSYPDLGVNTKRPEFPKLGGLPEKTVFLKKIFGMKKDRAIIPHGHSNMASAHLVLKGEMHLRHYDKIAVEEDTMIIQPTMDKIVGQGACSSISDEKNNVHWFIANTETAFTFDVIMLDLAGASYDIHNLDIYEKQSRSDGTYRVPILDVHTALKKYGKETHH